MGASDDGKFRQFNIPSGGAHHVLVRSVRKTEEEEEEEEEEGRQVK